VTGGTARLRVAVVVGQAQGGTAAHAAALALGSAQAGLTVSVLAPPDVIARVAAPSAAHRAGDRGEPVTTRPLRIGSRPNPVRDGMAITRLRSWLARWQPNVVHAHGVRAGAFAAVAIALSGRRRVRPALLVMVHNAAPDDRVAALVYGLLERVCARRADLVLCASADLTARLRIRGAATAWQFDVPASTAVLADADDTPDNPAATQAGVDEVPGHPAAAPDQPDDSPDHPAASRARSAGPNPSAAVGATASEPTPDLVAAVRRELGAEGRPVVLAVGRLAPQKGLDVLLEAASRWQGRDPRPVTVIAGDGPLSGRLAAHASGSGLGNDVRLLGQRHDVLVLLAAADVVVVPSRWEARALVVQEAMRMGRPIVATRVGGIPDLTGDDAALLVPPQDPDALAAAVAAVLDDPALAAKMGEAAGARATSFPSMDDAVRETVAIYARLAQDR
jgi:glycosyltransferase involved in cell wall biosynthesis